MGFSKLRENSVLSMVFLDEIYELNKARFLGFNSSCYT